MSTLERKAELVAKLREFRQALFAVIEGFTEPQTEELIFELDRRFSSIKQELDRLARMETTYRGWVRRALDEREPDVTEGVDGALVPPAPPEVNRRPVADILEHLREERRGTMALLDELEPRDFLRFLRTPMGLLSVDEVMSTVYRHDRELTLAIHGRDSGQLPRFLVGEYVPRRRYA
jgi:hypothetical protein